MNVYALQGPSNAGKTETIIMLFNELKKKYPNATFVQLHKRSRDIKIIMQNVNGKKIGIESMGDPGNRLEKSLDDFKNNNCEIIFCACRTTGTTVTAINNLNPPYNISFFSKVRSQNNYTSENLNVANTLISAAGL